MIESKGPFGDLLYKALNNRGISQTWLSQKTGLGKSIISKLVAGAQEARYEHIENIARALNMLPGDFFHELEGRMRFEPIINEVSIVRPLYEDATGRYFCYSVYAIEKYELQDLCETQNKGDTFILNMADGKFIINGNLINNGKVISKIKGTWKVPSGMHYFVSAVTAKKYTMEELLAYRITKVVPKK
jgi:transcriptional regulator with XRE-family HTH domain